MKAGDDMFSELGGITEETGLGYSDERASLYGEKRGFGVIVADTGELYAVKVFCEHPFRRETEIFPLVTALGEGLPKNTVMRQSCEVGYVDIRLDKFCLLQENIVYLTEFLDKLTEELEKLGLSGKPYSFPREKPAPAVEVPKGAVRVKLGFDFRSILGVFGALLGAFSMVVIAILTVDAKFEIDAFELRFEISTYILSAATAVVIFADYRFIARKLDACGVIVCPLLTLASVVLSGLGAGVRACAGFAEVSFMQALRGFPQYLDLYGNVGSFVFGYITRGLILAVVACVLIYIFYFNRHQDETELSEKLVSRDGKSDEAPEKRR